MGEDGLVSGAETLKLAGLDQVAFQVRVATGNQRYRCAACGVHAYVPRGRLSSAICRNCGAERFEPLPKSQP